jgi:FAD/FMN-containing dehydrogenase
VLECEVLLPDGSLVRLGDAHGENEGYDLLGTFVGSEGCFGVATQVTVRLVPLPDAVHTLLADFSQVTDAARAVSRIIASGIVPAALEMMDNATIRAVEASIYAAGYPVDAAAILLCEVDGPEAGLDEDVAIIREACMANGRARGTSRHRARRPHATLAGPQEGLWCHGPHCAHHWSCRTPSCHAPDCPRCWNASRPLASGTGVKVCNVFHAGDGNLHPNIPYDARDAEQDARVHAAMKDIMQTCIDAGGTITGEHGVGLDKIGYMDRLFDAPTLDAMCRLRSVFDPDRRANPGKVVPVHSCREWAGVVR